MKIDIQFEEGEHGEPIEFANAIIKLVMNNEGYPFEFNKNALAEIAGHLEVYLKHCEIEGERG